MYYCLLLRRYTVAYDLITIILLITVLNKYVDSGKVFEVRLGYFSQSESKNNVLLLLDEENIFSSS